MGSACANAGIGVPPIETALASAMTRQAMRIDSVVRSRRPPGIDKCPEPFDGREVLRQPWDQCAASRGRRFEREQRTHEVGGHADRLLGDADERSGSSVGVPFSRATFARSARNGPAESFDELGELRAVSRRFQPALAEMNEVASRLDLAGAAKIGRPR